MVKGTFTGGPDLVAQLGALSVELRKGAVTKAVREAAEPIRARIAELAPASADAPHIKDNIVVSSIPMIDGVRVSEGAAAVGIGPSKDFFYGWFLEFGWVFHPVARSFVRRAWEEGKEQAFKTIGASLWNAVAAAAKK